MAYRSLLLCFALLAACGSKSLSSGAGGSGGGGGASSTICPTTAPAPGAPCAWVGPCAYPTSCNCGDCVADFACQNGGVLALASDPCVGATGQGGRGGQAAGGGEVRGDGLLPRILLEVIEPAAGAVVQLVSR